MHANFALVPKPGQAHCQDKRPGPGSSHDRLPGLHFLYLWSMKYLHRQCTTRPSVVVALKPDADWSKLFFESQVVFFVGGYFLLCSSKTAYPLYVRSRSGIILSMAAMKAKKAAFEGFSLIPRDLKTEIGVFFPTVRPHFDALVFFTKSARGFSFKQKSITKRLLLIIMTGRQNREKPPFFVLLELWYIHIYHQRDWWLQSSQLHRWMI